MEFVLEDWERFRTVDGLSSKAGISRGKIASLVDKAISNTGAERY